MVFLWLWIPNEQRLSFRWVFRAALPNLLPEHARLCVRLVMKDGDAQQRNKLLDVAHDLFPNACEGGCGYHVGEMLSVCHVHSPTSFFSTHSCVSIPVEGWKDYVPGVRSVVTKRQGSWLSATQKIKQQVFILSRRKSLAEAI